MLKLIITVMVGFGLAGILVAGCGGGDGSAQAPVSLTKEQFVQRANKICGDAENEQFSEGFSYLEKHPGISEEEAVLQAALPPVEKAVTRLKAIDGADNAPALVAFVKAFEKALGKAKENPKQTLTPATNPFKAANKMAKELGIDSCASSP